MRWGESIDGGRFPEGGRYTAMWKMWRSDRIQVKSGHCGGTGKLTSVLRVGH